MLQPAALRDLPTNTFLKILCEFYTILCDIMRYLCVIMRFCGPGARVGPNPGPGPNRFLLFIGVFRRLRSVFMRLRDVFRRLRGVFMRLRDVFMRIYVLIVCFYMLLYVFVGIPCFGGLCCMPAALRDLPKKKFFFC